MWGSGEHVPEHLFTKQLLMDRDIQYRAWDWQRMYIVQTLDWWWIGTRKLLAHIYVEWDAREREAGGFELMQYTWLKDKNWTKIFEWDVVKTPTWKVYEVRYYTEFTAFRLYDTDTSGIYLTNTLEIIWNLYEHPSLLTDK